MVDRMTAAHLPISAVLPVYNCRERLERHLRSVVIWAPMVAELIVVDSGSTDGTLELAQEVLTPFGARFISHPPGLYQSWNAGIAAASSPWCYISTVEDPIAPDGLAHLLEVAERHQADLVVSPPEILNEDGSAPHPWTMPSNRLAASLEALGIRDRLLERGEAIALFCGSLPDGLLGSSASNLYRTAFLQKRPFPVEFGHGGDTAWGLAASVEARIAFTTRCCASFYVQTAHRELSPSEYLTRHRAFARHASQALRGGAARDVSIAAMLAWFESYDRTQEALLDWLVREHVFQEQLEAMKAKYQGGILGYFRRMIRDELSRLLAPRP